MPANIKQNFASPSEKLIALYSLLLFARYPLSLTYISEQLQCSKQSVLRLIERIESSGYGNITRQKKGRETVYILSKPRNLPKISVNSEGLYCLPPVRRAPINKTRAGTKTTPQADFFRI